MSSVYVIYEFFDHLRIGIKGNNVPLAMKTYFNSLLHAPRVTSTALVEVFIAILILTWWSNG